MTSLATVLGKSDGALTRRITRTAQRVKFQPIAMRQIFPESQAAETERLGFKVRIGNTTSTDPIAPISAAVARIEEALKARGVAPDQASAAVASIVEEARSTGASDPEISYNLNEIFGRLSDDGNVADNGSVADDGASAMGLITRSASPVSVAEPLARSEPFEAFRAAFKAERGDTVTSQASTLAEQFRGSEMEYLGRAVKDPKQLRVMWRLADLGYVNHNGGKKFTVPGGQEGQNVVGMVLMTLDLPYSKTFSPGPEGSPKFMEIFEEARGVMNAL